MTADDGLYDFILCEASFNVLPKESAKMMYKTASELLNKNGLIITKEWIRFSNKPKSVEHLIDEYRHSSNTYDFYSFTCIPLMLYFYDYENEKITLKDLDKGVQNLLADNIITQKEYETIGVHEYQNVELELYIPDIVEFEQDMKEYFDLVFIHNVNIAYSEYHPIFVYERK